MSYLDRLRKSETKDYLVEGTPRETLNRVEAYLLRAGYWMATGARTDVQASFIKLRGLLDYLSLTDGFFVKAVVSSEGEGQTRLTLRANEKAKEDAERMIREEFSARPYSGA